MSPAASCRGSAGGSALEPRGDTPTSWGRNRRCPRAQPPLLRLRSTSTPCDSPIDPGEVVYALEGVHLRHAVLADGEVGPVEIPVLLLVANFLVPVARRAQAHTTTRASWPGWRGAWCRPPRPFGSSASRCRCASTGRLAKTDRWDARAGKRRSTVPFRGSSDRTWRRRRGPARRLGPRDDAPGGQVLRGARCLDEGNHTGRRGPPIEKKKILPRPPRRRRAACGSAPPGRRHLFPAPSHPRRCLPARVRGEQVERALEVRDARRFGSRRWTPPARCPVASRWRTWRRPPPPWSARRRRSTIVFSDMHGPLGGRGRIGTGPFRIIRPHVLDRRLPRARLPGRHLRRGRQARGDQGAQSCATSSSSDRVPRPEQLAHPRSARCGRRAGTLKNSRTDAPPSPTRPRDAAGRRVCRRTLRIACAGGEDVPRRARRDGERAPMDEDDMLFVDEDFSAARDAGREILRGVRGGVVATHARSRRARRSRVGERRDVVGTALTECRAFQREVEEIARGCTLRRTSTISPRARDSGVDRARAMAGAVAEAGGGGRGRGDDGARGRAGATAGLADGRERRVNTNERLNRETRRCVSAEVTRESFGEWRGLSFFMAALFSRRTNDARWRSHTKIYNARQSRQGVVSLSRRTCGKTRVSWDAPGDRSSPTFDGDMLYVAGLSAPSPRSTPSPSCGNATRCATWGVPNLGRCQSASSAVSARAC